MERQKCCTTGDWRGGVGSCAYRGGRGGEGLEREGEGGGGSYKQGEYIICLSVAWAGTLSLCCLVRTTIAAPLGRPRV